MARRRYDEVLRELESLERAMRDPAAALDQRARMTAQKLDLFDEGDAALAWLERNADQLEP